MSSSSKPMALLGSRPSLTRTPLRPDLPMKRASDTSARSSLTCVSELEKPEVNLEHPSLGGASPRVSTLARRIHGWSWQAVRLAPPGASDTIIISLSIVSHRHGHGCCLRHSVGLERAPGTSHERRDRVFLHKPLALYPQLIDSPAPSVMCGHLSFGHVHSLSTRIL